MLAYGVSEDPTQNSPLLTNSGIDCFDEESPERIETKVEHQQTVEKVDEHLGRP